MGTGPAHYGWEPKGGLSRFDTRTEKFEHFVENSENPNSLSSNGVNSVISDSAGTIWIGSWGGLDRFDRETGQFASFDTGAPVSSLYRDRSGGIWIGTFEHLLFVNQETGQTTRFFHDERMPSSLSNNSIQCIYRDRTGALWFGTRNGVNRLDREQQRFKQIIHDPDNENSLSNNGIAAMHAGPSGALWVVNWGDRGMAIDKMDLQTKQVFRSLPGLQKKDLGSEVDINHIFEDSAGLLWLAINGLGRFDPERGQLTRFVHDSNDPYSLITNDLECTYEDQTGRLWVAIYHYGPTIISKLDREKGRFSHIRLVPESSGLSPKNGIASISQGKSGRLWFATISTKTHAPKK